jgi:hypothetical protein
MPSHYWNNEWFQKHGKDLNRAINYCMYFWNKWGRFGSFGKEKYGIFRDHPRFYHAWWPIHELVNPGYAKYSWSKWVYKIEFLLQKPVKLLRLDKLVQWWQRQVYNYAIQKVCKKYPNIIDEIVADLDYYHFVKPGIFGNIDGTIIHDKYWKTIK